VVQLAACAYLEDDVDVLVVVEVTVHFDNVRVVEEHLDFELPDKLLGDLLLDEQVLLDNFKSTYEPGALFPHEINPPVLAVTKLLHFLEILSAYLFSVSRQSEHLGAARGKGFLGSGGLGGIVQLQAASFHVVDLLDVTGEEGRHVRFLLVGFVLAEFFYLHEVRLFLAVGSGGFLGCSYIRVVL